MGRAKSNTKRRPKGKRGWRKIILPELDNVDGNDKNKKRNSHFDVRQSNDSDLFSIDKKVRNLKIKNIKQSAKDSLMSHGIKFYENGITKNVEFQKKQNDKISKEHKLNELTKLLPTHTVKSRKKPFKLLENEIEYRKRKPTKPKNMARNHMFKQKDIWDDTLDIFKKEKKIDLPRNGKMNNRRKNVTNNNNSSNDNEMKSNEKKKGSKKRNTKDKKNENIETSESNESNEMNKNEIDHDIDQTNNEKNEKNEKSVNNLFLFGVTSESRKNETTKEDCNKEEVMLTKKSQTLLAQFEKENENEKKMKENLKMERKHNSNNSNNSNNDKNLDSNNKSYLAGEHIKEMRRANKASLKSNRAVFNKYIAQNGIRPVPLNGESINPLPLDYYRLAWQSTKMDAKLKLFDEWQGNLRTLKWYESMKPNKNAIRKFRKRSKYHQALKVSDAMKKEYLDELNKWKNVKMKMNKEKNKNKKRKEMEKNNDKNERGMTCRRVRFGKNGQGYKNQRFIRGSIYGYRHKFMPAVTKGLTNLNQLKKGMRYNIDDGHIHNHALSYFYNNLQRSNRAQGKKIKKFIFQRRPWFGPRFKEQTRIGKLHHANVGTKLFEGIDE